ncbi:MAG: SAM-dependent methyltransferase [Buchnera aphidicola (Floraphis choui)]
MVLSVSKARSLSSKRWIRRHIKDPYVNLSYKKNIRSRAYFKLDHIHNVSKLFKKGMAIIDLGSSPGSWSQYASKKIGDKGCIIACDILPMFPIKGVFFIQGDIRQFKVINVLLTFLKNKKVDLVMSDMAPNMSGSYCIDHPRSIKLSKLALEISKKILLYNGKLLVKAFYGDQFRSFIDRVKTEFTKVKIFKPNSSRIRSREVYVIASERKK